MDIDKIFERDVEQNLEEVPEQSQKKRSSDDDQTSQKKKIKTEVKPKEKTLYVEPKERSETGKITIRNFFPKNNFFQETF